MAIYPIQCCRECHLRNQCKVRYGGGMPPCSKVVAGKSTTNNTTKATILELAEKFTEKLQLDGLRSLSVKAFAKWVQEQ